MSKQLCPECGKTKPPGVPEGACPSCLLHLGLAAAQITMLERGCADYELLEEIARGGMGVVFRARQISLHRIVALKMLLPGVAGPESVRRFRTEAEAAAGLNHPGIVAIHEVGEHDGQPFLSMEYVSGPDLARRVKLQPPSVTESAHWTRQIAIAVHHAHQRGVLHRDLKPANVLLDDTSQARVTDFGLAKLLGDPRDATVAGRIMGTPSFMSPEQLDPQRGEATIASDVYGLGTILYFLLTGKPPFQAATIEQALLSVLHSEPTPPRALNPAVPRDLEIICLKCLAKEPARRYGTAREVADEIERFLEHKPIQARPAGAAERAWRWARRNPVVASLSVLLAALLAVGLVAQRIALRNVRSARDRTEQNIRYMLESLTPQLAEVGRSPLTAQVLAKLRPYFEEQSRLRSDAGFQTLHSIFLVKEAGAARDTGDLKRARGIVQEALEVLGRSRDPTTTLGWRTNRADTLAALRDVLRDTHDVQGALRVGGELVAFTTETLRGEPANGAFAAQLARAHFGLGDVAWEFDLHDMQQTNYEAGARLAAELAVRPEATAEWQSLNGFAHYNLGRIWQKQDQRERAEGAFREYLVIHEKLVARFPEAPQWQNELGVAQARLAEVIKARASTTARTNTVAAAALRAEAVRHSERGLELTGRLAARDPANVTWQQHHGELLRSSAILVSDVTPDDARPGPWLQSSCDIFMRLAAQEPERVDWTEQLQNSMAAQGDWFDHQGQTNLARVTYERDLTNQLASVAAFPDTPHRYQLLVNAYARIARHTRRVERGDAEYKYLRQAIDSLPGTNGWWRWARASLHTSAANYYYAKQRELEKMEPDLQAALELRLAIFAEVPDQANFWVYIPITFFHLGQSRDAGGKHAEALATARDLLRWLRTHRHIAQGDYKFRLLAADLSLLVVRHADPDTPFTAEAVALLREALEQLPVRAASVPAEDKTRKKLGQRLAQLEGTQPAPP